MFVLAAVFWRVIPIYSAMDINLWPKIESSIVSNGTSSTDLYYLQSLSSGPSSICISTFPNSSMKD